MNTISNGSATLKPIANIGSSEWDNACSEKNLIRNTEQSSPRLRNKTLSLLESRDLQLHHSQRILVAERQCNPNPKTLFAILFTEISMTHNSFVSHSLSGTPPEAFCPSSFPRLELPPILLWVASRRPSAIIAPYLAYFAPSRRLKL